MADDKVKFELDLDAKEFIEKILHSKGVLLELGDAKNLDGLIAGLGAAGAALGALGVAAYGIKKAFETVFEAEEIKAINSQFETLGKMAGIATDTLAEGLVKAADGLIDDTDLLKAANQAIVTMGKSAEKLPEVLELARKASSVMGTDFMQTFEQMNHAIATGQTRSLKSIGINIDAEKAMKAYAAAHNMAVNEISQVGKQQAILNAVLEQGNGRFKDVDVNLKQATNSWQQFKVTLDQVGEVATLAFERRFGGAVKSALDGLKEFSNAVKERVLENIGTDSEQSAAKVKRLTKEIDQTRKYLDSLTASEAKYAGVPGMEDKLATTRDYLKTTREHLRALNDELDASKNKIPEKAGETGVPGADSEVEIADLAKRKENQAKFHQDLISMRQSRVQMEMGLAKSYADYESALEDQKRLAVEKSEADKDKIRTDVNLNAQQRSQMLLQTESNTQMQLAQFEEQARARAFQTQTEMLAREQTKISAQMSTAMSEQEVESLKDQQLEAMEMQHQMALGQLRDSSAMTEEQKMQAIVDLEETYQAQRRQSIWETENQRIAALENAARHSESVFDRMAAAGELAAQRSMQAWSNHEAGITRVAGSMSNHLASAFQHIADGSEQAGEAMLKAILGTIADESIARGSMLLLAGIANPALIPAGIGLIALGGTLKGLSSGKSKMSSVATASTGGGTDSGAGGGAGGSPVAQPGAMHNFGAGGSNRITTPEIKSFERQQKVVSLNIQGSYFETEQTKIRLVEMIRESSDATDFNIKQIGES